MGTIRELWDKAEKSYASVAAVRWLEKKEIIVMVNPRTGMRAQYQNTVYAVKHYEPTEKPARPKVSKAAEDKRAEAVSPHLKHGDEAWKAIWWFEDYNETLRFLYELFFAKQQASQT